MFFGNVGIRLMCDRLVEIGVELLTDGLNGLQTILRQKILELFEDKAHSGIDWRALSFAPCSFQSQLEVIDNRNQFFEQTLIRVFDRFIFFASTALLVIIKVRLAPHRQITEPVKIGLHAGEFVLGVGLFGRRAVASLLAIFSYRNFFHVFLIAIKVMSSFWGVGPTKFRRSSINLETIA